MAEKQNEKQLLRNPDIEPTNEVIAEALGEANNCYTKFIEDFETHDIQVYWRYYNDGKAWLGKGLYKWMTVRGTPKETTAFWLSIWEGFFKVSIFIPEKARAEALNLPLDSETKRMIENARQMGKLKFFPLVFDVCSDKQHKEIYTLVNFRKTLK